jgi:hypothetical protein
MTKLIVALSACLPFLSIMAQDASPTGSPTISVLDSLKHSRDFYSNNHLVVVGAAAPASFKFDRYPANGPERIQTGEGTYTRQGGQAWAPFWRVRSACTLVVAARRHGGGVAVCGGGATI